MNKHFCPNPFIYLTNSTEGQVKFCCLVNRGIKDANGNEYNSSTANMNEVWNSQDLNAIRAKMIAGEAVPECRECYKIEEHGGGSLRKDLMSGWYNGENKERLQKALDEYQSGQAMTGPVSVEVRTGSICNLKCRMCRPADSILIEKEYNKLNRTTDGKWQTLHFGSGSSTIEHDKYFLETINNFQHIDVLRFSGGEPFLNESTNHLIAEAARTGHSQHIELFVNTNFTRITPQLLEDMSTFKAVNIDISLDGYKGVHEYIRTGLKWETIESNLEMIKPYLSKHFYLTTNTTVQNLNVLYLEDVLRWTIKDLNITPVLCTLTNPSWLSVGNMPEEMKDEARLRIQNLINSDLVRGFKFPEWLIGRLNTILDAINVPANTREFERFIYFSDILDKERNQSTQDSIPEVAKFYERFRTNG
jgi:organic radical activating enzyme